MQHGQVGIHPLGPANQHTAEPIHPAVSSLYHPASGPECSPRWPAPVSCRCGWPHPRPVQPLQFVIGERTSPPEGFEHAGLSPFPESAMGRTAGADAGLVQGIPLAPGPKHKEDRVHGRAVIDPRVVPAPGMESGEWQQHPDLLPKVVRKPPGPLRPRPLPLIGWNPMASTGPSALQRCGPRQRARPVREWVGAVSASSVPRRPLRHCFLLESTRAKGLVWAIGLSTLPR